MIPTLLLLLKMPTIRTKCTTSGANDENNDREDLEEPILFKPSHLVRFALEC